MSWVLFLDESGHDHKVMPYEVRGGIALHAGELWPFVQAMQRLELDCFGCQLHEFGHELKGCTLLDKKRFRFAQQLEPMKPESRRKHITPARKIRTLAHTSPTRQRGSAFDTADRLNAAELAHTSPTRQRGSAFDTADRLNAAELAHTSPTRQRGSAGQSPVFRRFLPPALRQGDVLRW